MRLLVLLLLLTYAAAHPAAVHTLVTLGTHALPALSHLGSAVCGRGATHAAVGAGPAPQWDVGSLTPRGSHWNGATLGSHWNGATLGSHWNRWGA